MNCAKCKGMMEFESFEDYLGTESFRSFKGWRCVNCGRISDPTIASNKIFRDPTCQSRRWRNTTKS